MFDKLDKYGKSVATALAIYRHYSIQVQLNDIINNFLASKLARVNLAG